MTAAPPTIGTDRKRKLIAVYRPLDWQIAPWRDTSLVMLLTGSAGGGKSRLAAEKAHAYCLKYPKATALALRKTRQSMENSTVLMLKSGVIGDDPSIKHNQAHNRFEYPNGSILAYGGMKDAEQREQIRSIGQAGGVGFCWMEEANAFTESDFNEVLARMRSTAAPWRQIVLTTNPDSPVHWIYKRLILGREANVYSSGASDNPHNPAEYLDTLAKLTGVQKDRLAGGKWVQAEGVVYPDFNASIHQIERFDIPPHWRRIRSIDFGYSNPFVCQWWAFDHDDRMYLYREIYRTKRIVEDHAREIVDLSQGENIEATVADHDAEDRATLLRHGIATCPAYKAVARGIQTVQARLRDAGDGKPRLYVMDGALVERDSSIADGLPASTVEEFGVYVWPTGLDGKPQKEEPVKLNDHGMDAMRYGVAYADNLNGSRFTISGSPVVIVG